MTVKPWVYRRVAYAFAALVLAFAVIGQLEGLLKASHPDRRIGGGLDAIVMSPIQLHGPNHRNALAIVSAWHDYSAPAANRPVNSALALASWSIGVRAFVIVPLVTMVLWLIVHRVRKIPVQAEPGWRAIHAVATHRRLPILIVVATVAASMENLFTWAFVRDAWSFPGKWSFRYFSLAYGAGAVKWIAIVAVTLPFVALAARRVRPLVVPVARAAWLPATLLVFLAIAVDSDQGLDTLRRWEPLQGVLTSVTLALGAVGLCLAGGRSLDGAVRRRPASRAEPDPREPRRFRDYLRSGRAMWPMLVASAVSFALGLTVASGFLVPGAALLAMFLLSVPIDHWWSDEQLLFVPRPTSPSSVRRAGAFIGAVAVLIVGRACVSAAAGELFYRSVDGAHQAVLSGQGAMLAYGVGIGLLAVPGFEALVVLNARIASPQRRPARKTVALLGGSPVVVFAVLLALPATSFAVSAAFGSVGVALVFVAAACAADVGIRLGAELSMLTAWSRRWANPAVLRSLRFERPPVVGAFLVWAMLAGVVDRGGYHDVRLLEDAPPPPVSVDAAFLAWQKRLPPIPFGLKEANDPMVLVAASGGGIRAAYWTSAVLTCLIERDSLGADPCGSTAPADEVARRRARLFLMSGISGSSLGLVAYERHANSGEPSVIDGRPWYEKRLTDDFLAPTLARWLFVDTPNLLARVTRSGLDRAAALEVAWERSWRSGPAGNTGGLEDSGFFAGQKSPKGPVLLLNGYSATDGCRVLASALETTGDRGADQCGRLEDVPVLALPGTAGAPDAKRPEQLASLDATTDAHDLTCRDVRWSTAALLSARFPFVSPSGRLTCPNRKGSPRAYVVDGGYRDTSAASTIVELWPKILHALNGANDELALRGGCIVPFFLQIDNDYETDELEAPDARPNEILLPAQAIYRTQSGNAKAARSAAQRLFSGPVDGDGSVVSFRYDPRTQLGEVGPRWLRFYPHSHPGSAAPLGWVLSKAARADLTDQLGTNRGAIEKARQWLGATQDSLRCTRQDEPAPVAADQGPTVDDSGEPLVVP